MPYRINGIGTIYIGARDFESDGTFLTTEWFTFIFVPVFPIRSHRVRPAGGNSYYLLQTTRPHPRQVLCAYGFTLLLVMEGALIAWISSRLETTRNELRQIILVSANFCISIVLLATLFIPWLLRRGAKRAAPQSTSPTE